MIIKNNCYKFSFWPIKYEFNEFTVSSDIYDLNWLVCSYEFTYKGQLVYIENASFTTFDILNFICEIEQVIKNKEYKQIELQNLEPDFLMKLIVSSNGYSLVVHYNFHLNDVFESLDFNVFFNEKEIKEFIEELKQEFSKFPYRRIVEYFGISNKYKSFIDIFNAISSDKIIKGEITHNCTDILIQKNEFFNIKISDIYCMINNKFLYTVLLNNKPYCNVEEDNLLEELYKIYNSENIVVEYNKAVGFAKQSWFKILKKEKLKLTRINKKISRVFTAEKLYYYNNKNIKLKKELINKNKLADLDSRLVCLYYSSDYTKRIQIYKNENSFSYIFEKLEIKEENEYGETYNYAYWDKIDDGISHYYISIEDLEKDIEYIITINKLVKYSNNL